MVRIGTSDLEVYPLNLGGNVFGWTADQAESFAVLDAFAAAGGNFIDSADVYSMWKEGNSGGESETILGNWMRERGNRADTIIATKIGSLPPFSGASRASIRGGIEASLRRLQTDYIDLYYIHRDDEQTPLAETIAALAELIAEGKVRYVAASNYSADRLREALRTADELGAPRFVALQPKYNLLARTEFEGDLQAVVAENGLSTLPYSSLASGFLTGKYRDPEQPGSSPRAKGALAYLDDRGRRVLAALDTIAAAHGVEVSTVALAWLASRPTVAAPIASARDVSQLPALLASTTLQLSSDELDALTSASA